MLFRSTHAAPDDALVAGVAAALKAWPWQQRPEWVTWIPSRSRPLLVEGLARRLAELGKLELVDAVRRRNVAAPPQTQMENSAARRPTSWMPSSSPAATGRQCPPDRAWWSMTPFGPGGP